MAERIRDRRSPRHGIDDEHIEPLTVYADQDAALTALTEPPH
ncbi:hypothetical protein AB0O76_07195 [Streptomyces sp. NPDC086554]